jgi:hypothetical protein
VIALGPILMVAIIAAVVALAPSGHRTHPAMPVDASDPVRPGAGDLDRWVAAGLVAPEQAEAIRAFDRAAVVTAPAPPAGAVPASARPPRRIPVIAEALGYLGGMLAVIGLGLVIGRSWSDLGTPVRLAISGGGALALLAGGSLVPEGAEPALTRLRWFLWLAASAATALFMGVVAIDGFGADGDQNPETVALPVAAVVALQSSLLWRNRDRPLQQVVFLGATAVTVGAAVAYVGGATVVGLSVWVAGAAFVVAGWRRRTVLPALTAAIGAAALVVGAGFVAVDAPAFGLPLEVATALSLLALGLVPRLAPTLGPQMPLTAIGALALLQALPSTLGYFARDAGAVTGLAVWLAGAGLLVVAARRLVRAPVATEVVAAAALLGGAALVGVQLHGPAPLFGIATAIGLLVLGTRPGQVLMSVAGSLGLLINVPWAIGWFFPGEGRVPLLILVAGGLILGIAVLLGRHGGDRFRREFRGGRPRPA